MAEDLVSETGYVRKGYDSMNPKSVDALVGFYLILLLFGSSFLLIFIHVVLPSYGISLYQWNIY